MNRVRLAGVLGAEPEVTTAGVRLRVWTPDNEWHRVTVDGETARAMAPSLHKGDQVLVDGRLHSWSYLKNGETRWATDIIASRVLRPVKRVAP